MQYHKDAMKIPNLNRLVFPASYNTQLLIEMRKGKIIDTTNVSINLKRQSNKLNRQYDSFNRNGWPEISKDRTNEKIIKTDSQVYNANLEVVS